MARPSGIVKDPAGLSNLRKSKDGTLTFSSDTLYQYEIDRAAGRISSQDELYRIGLCLQHGVTRSERNRLLYRSRKLTGRLPVPKQTKLWKVFQKAESYLKRIETELRKEGVMQ